MQTASGSSKKWERNQLLLPWCSPSSNISTNYYFILILPQDMNGSAGVTIHWAWLGSRWKWCLNLKQSGTSVRWFSTRITCSPRMFRWVLAECVFTSLLILIARFYSFSHFHFLIKTNKKNYKLIRYLSGPRCFSVLEVSTSMASRCISPTCRTS